MSESNFNEMLEQIINQINKRFDLLEENIKHINELRNQISLDKQRGDFCRNEVDRHFIYLEKELQAIKDKPSNSIKNWQIVISMIGGIIVITAAVVQVVKKLP